MTQEKLLRPNKEQAPQASGHGQLGEQICDAFLMLYWTERVGIVGSGRDDLSIKRASPAVRRKVISQKSDEKVPKLYSFGTSSGRGRRNRTLGTRFWRPLLYLLSYTPISSCQL